MTIASQPGTAPDWSTIAETIRCPLCEYDLRGLSEPRCPECGHEFDWREILSADHRPHPYLFEHHPERNVWSFRQTKWHALLPGSFWRTLKPLMRSVQRRLILYWLISVPLVSIPFAYEFLSQASDTATELQRLRQRISANAMANPNSAITRNMVIEYGSVQNAIDAYAPPTFSVRFIQRVWNQNGANRSSGQFVNLPIILAFAAWPWLTIAAMNVFQISMRRAKIRQIHVMRCALYSCDSGLIAGIALLWILNRTGGSYTTLPFTNISIAPSDAMVHLFGAAVAFALLGLYKLAPAYKHYLRFPHAVATAIATQLLVALAVVSTIARIYRLN